MLPKSKKSKSDASNFPTPTRTPTDVAALAVAVHADHIEGATSPLLEIANQSDDGFLQLAAADLAQFLHTWSFMTDGYAVIVRSFDPAIRTHIQHPKTDGAFRTMMVNAVRSCQGRPTLWVSGLSLSDNRTALEVLAQEEAHPIHLMCDASLRR